MVLDTLLHKQSSKNRPAELNLSRKGSINLLDHFNIALGAPNTSRNNHGTWDPQNLIATTGTTNTNQSVRLLSEFK